MNLRAALDATTRTTPLDGARPAIIGQRAWLASIFVGLGGSVGIVLAFGDRSIPYGLALASLTIAGIFASTAWNRRSGLALRAAAEAMNEGRIDEAEKRLVAVLAKARIDQHVALALHWLGNIALRRGRFGDAVHLYRAAFEIEQRRIMSKGVSMGGNSHASLVLALVGSGELDVARKTMDEPEPKGSGSVARALLARARALYAMRTGDPKTALDVLEANRRLMQNVLTGNDAALTEVLEASALTALAATGDSTARAAHPVFVDAEARAFVMRLLPECEPLLLDDSF